MKMVRAEGAIAGCKIGVVSRGRVAQSYLSLVHS